jgi:uncharacterized integral membrane protein (TIGR00698 family)
VLLGARIPFAELLETGRAGLGMSLVSVALVLLIGTFLGRRLGVSSPQTALITSGTAICGGSAIAAVAPTIRAGSLDMGVSIAIVFILNAVAAVIFPPIGRWIELSDSQFAAWAALAIHDTSSVVAAAAQWSEEALRQATTIKLSRTLWILPLVLYWSMIHTRAQTATGLRPRWSPPWFILGFVLLSVLGSRVEWLSQPTVSAAIRAASHWGFAASLLLIGMTIPREQLKAMGSRPFQFGAALWLLTLAGSLAYVKIWI